ncbi:MAG: methyltransferase domain-containing protein [Crocinitomicaceae bacterium]|nr:methyltransferase domain-containing protein [Crocinitomicaceae bacterium]
MQERHSDRSQYFNEQTTTVKDFIFPMISKYKNIDSSISVLEVGCGYGGNLVPFIEAGCQVTGIDLLEDSIETAKIELDEANTPNLTLIASDIYKVTGMENKFDVIFMKDTLEHIPNQEKLIPFLKTFLKDDGIMFQGFPPWRNPFGGHQQMSKSKFLSRLPWFHVSPRFMFKGILKMFGETPQKIEGFMEGVYDTRISIQRFRRIIRKNGFVIKERTHYFINPNYQIKFGLKPRVLWKVLDIPWFRDWWTTTCYYVLAKK